MSIDSDLHEESTPQNLEALHSSEGFCEIAHLSPDGRFMLSAGLDGRVMAVDTAAEPPMRLWAKRVTGGGKLSAAAVSPSGDWLALGQEYEASFGVWVYPLDQKTGLGKVKLAARFTLPVRHLSWHPSKPLLGMATDDGKISVWDRDAARKRDFPTGTKDGGARCVAFDPRGELVAVAFASGALVLYSLQDTMERYRGTAWSKSIIGSERLILSWRPDGDVLALPGAPAVRLVERGKYESTATVLENGHRFSSTAAAWSEDGTLLATASSEAVALWRPAEKLPLCHIFRFSAAPYSLKWGGDHLGVGMAVGSWVRLQAPQRNQQAAAPPSQAEASPAAPGEEKVDPLQSTKSSQSLGMDSQAESQAQTEVAQAAAVVVQRAPFQPGATCLDPRRRWLAWNEHGVLKFFASDDRGREDAGRRGKSGRSKPSSVPSGGRIEVEYSRERGRSAVREIRAPDGLLMGALGPGMVALATVNSMACPARIIVHLSVPWERPSFEFSLPDDDERVEALAVGRNFLAALTSRRQLRVLTITGVPIGVLALAGPPVCLAACEDLLLCITLAPGPQGAEPALEYALYGISAKERLASGRLPLSPEASLRWIGFSAEALPMALDSAGVLRVLALSGGAPLLASSAGDWVPVVELEDRGARFWPVRAEGSSLFGAQASKSSGEPRPGAVQRLQAVRFRLPFSADVEPAERFLRQRLSGAHLSFALEAGLLPTPARNSARDAVGQRLRADSHQVLKLFESTAKLGNLEEALDIASNYFSSSAAQQVRLLQDARGVANTLGLEALAERVAAVLRSVEQEREAAARAAAEALERTCTQDDDAEASSSSDEGEESGSEAATEDQPMDDKPGLRRGLEEAGLSNELPPAARLRTV